MNYYVDQRTFLNQLREHFGSGVEISDPFDRLGCRGTLRVYGSNETYWINYLQSNAAIERDIRAIVESYDYRARRRLTMDLSMLGDRLEDVVYTTLSGSAAFYAGRQQAAALNLHHQRVAAYNRAREHVVPCR